VLLRVIAAEQAAATRGVKRSRQRDFIAERATHRSQTRHNLRVGDGARMKALTGWDGIDAAHAEAREET